MSYGESWAELNGVEIWNSARTAAYIRNGLIGPMTEVRKCVTCDGIGPAVEGDGFEGYTFPDTDLAPWYDPTIPESADFAGLLITEIAGLEDSPYQRNAVTTLTGGGALGRRSVGPRQVTVQAVLLGRTCCAINYGRKWLTSALFGNAGLCGCDSGQFMFLTCCPEVDDNDEPCGPLADRDPIDHEANRYAEFFRTACNAGALSGPTVTNRIGGSCGCGGCAMLEVEFVLAMGPFLYGDPIELIPQTLFSELPISWNPPPPEEECIELELEEDCPECGSEVEWAPSFLHDCDEAGCGVVCLATGRPLNVADPMCGPTFGAPNPPVPDLPCLDQALCLPLETRRVCTLIDLSAIGDWRDAVLDVEVFAGARPVRNLHISAYRNPSHVYPEHMGMCDICAGFIVTYIPCEGTLSVDGACRAATISIGAQSAAAGQNLVAHDGAPFDYPALSETHWTLCIDADAETIADDAWVRVSLRSREA